MESPLRGTHGDRAGPIRGPEACVSPCSSPNSGHQTCSPRQGSSMAGFSRTQLRTVSCWPVCSGPGLLEAHPCGF